MTDIITQLKDRWFLLAFLASLAIWFGTTNYRLSSVEAKQQETDTKIQAFYEMKTDIAVIRTKVENIEQNIK